MVTIIPSRRVHHKLWKKNTPNALLCAAGVFFISPIISGGVLAGYLLGDVVNPDLDLEGITQAEATMFEISKPLGYLWYWYWRPYALLRHRHWLSHGLVISTVGRLLYLFWWAWFIPPQRWLDIFMVGVFLGLVVSDSVHIIADILLTQAGELKRRT